MPFVFAYLDPASGALIVQALIAGLVAIPILLRDKVLHGARAVMRAVTRSRKEPSAHDSPPG